MEFKTCKEAMDHVYKCFQAADQKPGEHNDMDPFCAYMYAKCIDKFPWNYSRNAACKEPEYAYLYAKDVDRKSRDDTRKAACKNSKYAYLYAIEIDKCPTEDTWLAVKNTEYEETYRKIFNELMKEEII